MQPAELRRHKNRATYDIDSVASVFADTYFAHVSYIDNDEPQCLPMIALVRKADDQTAVYLHGHPSSRLMELVRGKGESEKKEIKVCITATKVDGLVLSSAPNGHTYNYRSAVVHGVCSLVEDLDVKREVVRGVTNHILPGRWEDVNPVASFMVSLVCVIRVDILSLSMKSREGIPGIHPRNQEKDGPDHTTPVWTGTVPLHEVLGSPVPSGLTDNAKVPKSLATHIERRNEEQKKHSLAVSRL